jgi:hypothetical protein
MADTVVVVNRGLQIVTDRLMGSGTEPKYLGWGTGTTAAASTDAGLETARAEGYVTGTSTNADTNTTLDTYRVTGTITCSGSSGTISEVCLFDSSSTTANAFLRGTFTGISLNVADSIAFTINAVFDQA